MALRTTPSVEGARQRVRALVGATLFTFGLTAGAAAFAGTVSIIAGMVASREVALGLTSILATLLLASALLRRRWSVPSRSLQVPQSWFVRRGVFAFLPAGLVLGAGVLTPIRNWTFLLFTGCVSALEPKRALAIGVIYGLARAVPSWRNALSRPGTMRIDARALARGEWRSRRNDLRVAVAVTAVVIGGVLASLSSGQSVVVKGAPNAPAIAPDFQVVGEDPGLIDFCRSTAITRRFAYLLNAFNSGLARRFAAAFVSPSLLTFQPYNANRFAYPLSVEAFVRSRYRAGDGWTATQLDLPHYASPGSAIYGLQLLISSRGERVTEGGTKIVVRCATGKIQRWVGPPHGP